MAGHAVEGFVVERRDVAAVFLAPDKTQKIDDSAHAGRHLPGAGEGGFVNGRGGDDQFAAHGSTALHGREEGHFVAVAQEVIGPLVIDADGDEHGFLQGLKAGKARNYLREEIGDGGAGGKLGGGFAWPARSRK